MSVNSTSVEKDSQASQVSLNTWIDRDASRDLRILAIDRQTNVRAILSEVIRAGVEAIRSRETA